MAEQLLRENIINFGDDKKTGQIEKNITFCLVCKYGEHMPVKVKSLLGLKWKKQNVF